MAAHPLVLDQILQLGGPLASAAVAELNMPPLGRNLLAQKAAPMVEMLLTSED